MSELSRLGPVRRWKGIPGGYDVRIRSGLWRRRHDGCETKSGCGVDCWSVWIGGRVAGNQEYEAALTLLFLRTLLRGWHDCCDEGAGVEDESGKHAGRRGLLGSASAGAGWMANHKQRAGRNSTAPSGMPSQCNETC